MKIKSGYLLRTIADTNIVVPISERVIEFKGLITLNDVSADIWRFLETDKSFDEIVTYMTNEYGIDKETAEKDLTVLLQKMEDNGLLE